MRIAYLMLVAVSVATVGCRMPVPRGHFFLPEDSFMTYKRIESLVPAGTPIDEARETMELHGFVCTFEESVGIPYLQCNQITRQHLWPFNGSWMATIYYEHGLVSAVQARYDLNPVEIGTRVPKRASRKAKRIDEAKDAKAEALPVGVPIVPADGEILQVVPGEVLPAAPSPTVAEPPAVVPLDTESGDAA